MSEVFAEIRAYLACEGLRLDNDVHSELLRI